MVLGQLLFPEVAGLRVDGVWREGLTWHVRAATDGMRWSSAIETTCAGAVI